MPYGIFYLPDPDDHRRMQDLAEELGALTDPLMVLGDGRPAHLTLVHHDGDAALGDEIWGSLAGLVPPRLTVTATGLMFSPIPRGNYHVPEGGIYAGLETLRDARLDEAHQKVAALCTERGVRLLTGVGDRFRPHFTLAILDRFPAGPVALPPDLLTGRFTVRLAMGRLGAHGTFPEILHRA